MIARLLASNTRILDERSRLPICDMRTVGNSEWDKQRDAIVAAFNGAETMAALLERSLPFIELDFEDEHGGATLLAEINAILAARRSA